jgi:transposase
METFSVNRLSETLEVDRSTMVRALKNTPPDAEKTPGRPTFKISTAAKALEAHRRAVGTSTPGGGSNYRRMALIDEEEATFATLDKQFERLEAEPSIEKRRALSLKMKIGATINRLEELFQETNQLDEMGSILALATEKMIGTARSRLIDRLDLWPEVDDLSAEIRAEKEAEYQQAKRAKEGVQVR